MRNYNAYSSYYFTFFVLESFKINSKKKKQNYYYTFMLHAKNLRVKFFEIFFSRKLNLK